MVFMSHTIQFALCHLIILFSSFPRVCMKLLWPVHVLSSLDLSTQWVSTTHTEALEPSCPEYTLHVFCFRVPEPTVLICKNRTTDQTLDAAVFYYRVSNRFVELGAPILRALVSDLGCGCRTSEFGRQVFVRVSDLGPQDEFGRRSWMHVMS